MKTSFPDFSVNGYNVLITGATGYLGKEIVSAFVDGGANVYVNSRDKLKIEKMVEEYSGQGKKIYPAVFDITSSDDIDKFFAGVGFKSLNVIVNNAYNGRAGGMNSKKEDFQKAYDISVSSPFNLIQKALPFLRESVKSGQSSSVINISSMYGLVSPKFDFYENENSYNPPFYGAAKAGLIQLTRYLGSLLAKEGIRVNAVSPGPFPNKDAQLNKRLIQGITGKSPMGRIGEPHELTGAVIFLASKASSYITGTNISVDGGWTAST